MTMHRKLTLDDKPYRLIPEEEYNAYLEALEDARDAAGIAASRGEETIPADLVDRMLACEHLAKFWYEHLNLKAGEAGPFHGQLPI